MRRLLTVTAVTGAVLGAGYAALTVLSVPTIEQVSFYLGLATAFAMQCPIIDRRAKSNRPGPRWDDRITAMIDRWRDGGRKPLDELNDGG